LRRGRWTRIPNLPARSPRSSTVSSGGGPVLAANSRTGDPATSVRSSSTPALAKPSERAQLHHAVGWGRDRPPVRANLEARSAQVRTPSPRESTSSSIPITTRTFKRALGARLRSRARSSTTRQTRRAKAVRVREIVSGSQLALDFEGADFWTDRPCSDLIAEAGAGPVENPVICSSKASVRPSGSPLRSPRHRPSSGDGRAAASGHERLHVPD